MDSALKSAGNGLYNKVSRMWNPSARGVCSRDSDPFDNPKAFAFLSGNDAAQVLGPVLTGLGSVVAVAALTGSLPAGIAIGSAIGLATGALKHIYGKIRGHGPPAPT